MKLNCRYFTLALMAVAGLAVAAPARADVLDNIMKAKKIRVATDLGIPPSLGCLQKPSSDARDSILESKSHRNRP
jgi:ABC-type amino acid transport substrate-binding protein